MVTLSSLPDTVGVEGKSGIQQAPKEERHPGLALPPVTISGIGQETNIFFWGGEWENQFIYSILGKKVLKVPSKLSGIIHFWISFSLLENHEKVLQVKHEISLNIIMPSDSPSVFNSSQVQSLADWTSMAPGAYPEIEWALWWSKMLCKWFPLVVTSASPENQPKR